MMKQCFVGLLVHFIVFFILAEAKYEIILERIENAFGADDKLVAFDGLRVKKYNRTMFVVNGKFDLKMDVDDTVDMKGFLLNYQGNKYKQMFDKRLGTYCETMYKDQYEGIFNRVHKQFKRPVPWKTCPYPKGENEITDLYLEDTGDFIPPYIPGSEKWQVQVRFYKDEKELGGYNVFAIIRSEKSLLLNGGK